MELATIERSVRMAGFILFLIVGACGVFYCLLMRYWSEQPDRVGTWFRAAWRRWIVSDDIEPVTDNVEGWARLVVRKIARANAAEHEYNRHVLDMFSPLFATANARRIERMEDAQRTRDYAIGELRQALGLPEHPTQAECAEWGEAP